MGEKKGKALALELIDDLLDEGKDKNAQKPEKPEKAKKSEPGAETPDVDVDGTSPIELLVAKESVKDEPLPPPSNSEEDRTMRINSENAVAPTAAHTAQTQALQTGTLQTAPTSQSELDDKVRASVGRNIAFRSAGSASATEAALAQSESLRIAQSRLLEFEQEIERLRLQNEELAAAGETLRRRSDELLADNQRREQDYQNAVSTFEQEKEILIGSKEALQRELSVSRQKNEELELRISTNIQKIRVRERELENRLELVKMESAALIRSKDEMILELKRQIDQLNLELNNYRTKNQELNRIASDKQEQLRRTVKALRLALSMLEGEEEAPKQPQRKAK